MEKALVAEKAQREQAERRPRWPWTHSTASTTASPTRMVVTPPTAGNDSVELPAQPALPPEAIPSSRSYSGRTSGSPAPAVNSRSCRSRRRRRTTASATSASGSADWRRPSPPTAAIDLYGRLPLDAAEDSVRIKLSRTCGELGRVLHFATVRRRGRYVRPGHTDHDARPDRVSEPARVPLRIGRALFASDQRDPQASTAPMGGPRGGPKGGGPKGGEPSRGPCAAGR